MPYIQSDAARIAYDAVGTGPAIVLLHSTASSASQWDATRRALADRFTMVAVDLHGYGKSDPWQGALPVTLDDEAAAVARVMDLFDEPAHLVGHSYGGAVALKLAQSGRRLASLTLVEPVAFHLLRDGSDFDRSLLQEFILLGEGVKGRFASGDCASAMEPFVDYWNGVGAWAGIPAERQQALCRMTGTVVRNFSSVLDDPGSLSDCATLRTPTLLMAGEQSPRTARRIAARLAATLPCVEFQRVEGAGHMLPRTHAATFLQALSAHLDGCAEEEAEPDRCSAA